MEGSTVVPELLGANPADRREGAPVFAAVDVGTNNCRLLVAKRAGSGLRVVDAFSRIVRLGEGVGRHGRLSDPAMDRTLSALQVCASKIRRRRVVATRAVATEACRRAANFPEFRQAVQTMTGIRLEVISADEEARLALAGCAPLLDDRTPYALVFDIGGGSTEIMWAETGRSGPRLLDSVSVPHGVVTLAEQHGGSGVSPDGYRRIMAEIAGEVASFEARCGIRKRIEDRQVQMIGCSGTVTTVAAVHRGMPRYDRSKVDGTWLDVSDARSTSAMLAAMDLSQRSRHPCIGPERADLVVPGCAVLEAICELWAVDRLRIADRGVREGILFDLMSSSRNVDKRVPGA